MRVPLKADLFAPLMCVFVLVLTPYDAIAKGPKGKGGGGRMTNAHSQHFQGGKPSSGYSSRPGTDVSRGQASHLQGAKSGSSNLPSHQASGKNRFPTTDGSLGNESHPWSMQRANERQKLDHRLEVADKLDQIAEQNGNTHLHDAAERKREKARELFEKRMAKIDEKTSLTDTEEDLQARLESLDSPDFPEPGIDPMATDQKLTGLENALSRQLQNEQRKLARQMETAERLWDAYEQTGDEQLANLAQAFEERSLSQYQKRMEAIRGFQDRHGLPDMIGDSLISENPSGGLLGEQPGTLIETITPLLP